MRVAVICAAGQALPMLPGDVQVIALAADDTVRGSLADTEGVVIVSSALPEESCRELAAALSESPRPSIEVRLAKWDGDGHSLLSAACTGVIFGFGDAGILAATRFLAESASG